MNIEECNFDLEASIVGFSKNGGRKILSILAVRSVLREVPLMKGALTVAWSSMKPDEIMLRVFQSLCIALYVIKNPEEKSHELVIRPSINEMNRASYSLDGRGMYAGVAEASRTLREYVLVDEFVDRRMALYLKKIYSGGYYSIYKFISQGMRRDIEFLRGGGDADHLLAMPLWSRGMPSPVKDRLNYLFGYFASGNQGWEVWTSWYDQLLHGRQAIDDRARIDVPEDVWRRGPLAANTEIERRLEEARRRKEDLDSANPTEPEQELGPSFELSAETGLSTTHLRVPQDVDDPEARREMHRKLCDVIPRLMELTKSVSNRYPDLDVAVSEYQGLIGRPIEEIDVAEVWGAGAALFAFADAFGTQNEGRTVTEPLEPHHLALLKMAARLHGAFILGYPLARRLMDDAERMKLAADTIAAIDGPTAEILTRFSEERDWVEDEARNFIETISAGYNEGGWKIAATGHAAYVVVRNALVVVTRHLARVNSGLSTIVGGALLGAADPGLEITTHAMRFVVESSEVIMAFAAPFPELRAWFAWVIDHLDGQNAKK